VHICPTGSGSLRTNARELCAMIAEPVPPNASTDLTPSATSPTPETHSTAVSFRKVTSSQGPPGRTA
jgi:hypothetical protein